MKSFDLFNTLVCTKNSDEKAGDFPIEDLVPIVENIAQVQPEDIIVSDFYDPYKADYIVRMICKLNNKLVITENGKATGDIWSIYEPEHHLGDNLQIDVITPFKHGISTSWTNLWKYYNNPILRGLYLHQVEKNFPFILKVAYRLNDLLIPFGYKRLLLCSRDCYLLYLTMKELFGTCYPIEYFYSNRLMRLHPTPDYVTYAKSMITDDTLIVDLCGSGVSLKHFCDQHGGNPYLIIANTDTVPHMLNSTINETINPAPHPTLTGWPMETTYTVKPEVKCQIDAFETCMKGDISEPVADLQQMLSQIEDDRLNVLWSDYARESLAMQKVLDNLN